MQPPVVGSETPDLARRSCPTGFGAFFALIVIAITATACGGSDIALSPVASEGRQISQSSGCAGCHGRNGNGGVGPGWIGLAGSQRLLTDGTSVLVDDEYLRRSIMDPKAQIVDGYTNVIMPTNRLSESEIDKVVAYINELAVPEQQ